MTSVNIVWCCYVPGQQKWTQFKLSVEKWAEKAKGKDQLVSANISSRRKADTSSLSACLKAFESRHS